MNKTKAPLVSIIIPTYNSMNTLAKCLQSIKNQSCDDIEVIVVDRGSTDKTIEIAKSFAVKFFVVANKERSGQINYGVSQARGKYIYRVDSDFILEPTVVEDAVQKSENGGYDAIYVPNISDP